MDLHGTFCVPSGMMDQIRIRGGGHTKDEKGLKIGQYFVDVKDKQNQNRQHLEAKAGETSDFDVGRPLKKGASCHIVSLKQNIQINRHCYGYRCNKYLTNETG